ncbi:hypothetical protein D3C81_2242360 [compost metagenome]
MGAWVAQPPAVRIRQAIASDFMAQFINLSPTKWLLFLLLPWILIDHMRADYDRKLIADIRFLELNARKETGS